jgi:hypothetical protein
MFPPGGMGPGRRHRTIDGGGDVTGTPAHGLGGVAVRSVVQQPASPRWGILRLAGRYRTGARPASRRRRRRRHQRLHLRGAERAEKMPSHVLRLRARDDDGGRCNGMEKDARGTELGRDKLGAARRRAAATSINLRAILARGAASGDATDTCFLDSIPARTMPGRPAPVLDWSSGPPSHPSFRRMVWPSVSMRDGKVPSDCLARDTVVSKFAVNSKIETMPQNTRGEFGCSRKSFPASREKKITRLV